MTEKEYEKWTDDLQHINYRIKNCKEKLERLNEVYNAFSEKHRGKLSRVDIEFEYESDKFGNSHTYYYTNSEKIIDCVKLEIENEIKTYKELISSSESERIELINSLSIKKE